jgi:hypothetical protein
MVFENGPQWAKMKIFNGDIHKAVKFKGRRRLLHGSGIISFRAQKDISFQSWRFLKFQFRIFENLSIFFRNSKVQKTCLDAL